MLLIGNGQVITRDPDRPYLKDGAVITEGTKILAVGGLEDLKAVAGRIREAGLVPGLHFHYNKVTTNDAYVVNGTPDPRLHGIRNLLLARPLAAM